MATVFNDATADHKWSTAGNWSDGKPDSADAVTLASTVTLLEIDEAADILSFSGAGTSGGVTVSGSGTMITTAFVLASNVTWNATGAITINSDSATAINFFGKTMPVVNFNSNASAARAHAITFGAGATFVQFNIDQLTDRRDVSLSFSGDFSVASSSTWKSGGAGNDDPTYRMLILSSAVGTTRTMTVSAASQTITLQDVDLQDIKISDTNSPTVSLTRVGDTGGNTATTGGGYIKDVSDPKTVYAIGGTSNIDYINTVWSTSSGGATDINNYPLPQDTAILDDNTWSDTNNIFSTTAFVRHGNIDSSALTENQLRLNINSPTYLYGNITLTGGSMYIYFLAGSGSIVFDARVAGTLSINADSVAGGGYATVDSYGGTVSLGMGWSFTRFTLTRGVLDLNGKTLTLLQYFSSSNANTRELKDTAGGGKIVVNALTGTGIDLATDTGLTVSNAPDIDIGDSNNTLTGNLTLAFGPTAKTFGDLTFTKHAGDFAYIITGVGNTFGAVTQETPDVTYQYNSVTWPASETANNVASYNAAGTVDYEIYIQSSSGGSPAHLLDSGGTNVFSYCTIQDMHVAGGATWDASNGTNTDISGNDGWTWAAGGIIGARFMHDDIFPTVQLFKGSNL